MSQARETPLRSIPSVEVLLQDADLRRATEGVPRRIVTDAVRRAVDEVRAHLSAGRCGAMAADAIRRTILASAQAHVRQAMGPHFRRVVNAAGIILHTALGRAVLPRRAIQQIQEHLAGYSLLQADEETGKRSRRDERIEWLLRQLTGAEAATVVNNNAAATMLVLNTVGKGREVIVSRGQLVEIGGSFRLPEVFATSGVRLVEVGSTNKTHLRDYEAAITDQTAAILRVHPSNYKIMGFTGEVPRADLVRLAHARGLVLIDDVGAGALTDFARFGFQDQETLPESIRDGADITTSSADKLIGGPQGGIILGRADLMGAVRKNPLARVVRVGKLTLAALEATLALFLDEAVALAEVPTLAMLARPVEELADQAARIAAAVRGRAGAGSATVEVIDGFSQMGSGSLPTQDMPTHLVSVRSADVPVDELARRLRMHEPPVFARIHHDAILIDPRTLRDGDEPILIDALTASLDGPEADAP